MFYNKNTPIFNFLFHWLNSRSIWKYNNTLKYGSIIIYLSNKIRALELEAT